MGHMALGTYMECFSAIHRSQLLGAEEASKKAQQLNNFCVSTFTYWNMATLGNVGWKSSLYDPNALLDDCPIKMFAVTIDSRMQEPLILMNSFPGSQAGQKKKALGSCL